MQALMMKPLANDRISCSWKPLRELLLKQWKRLNPADLDNSKFSRKQIAMLIQRQYGIAHELVEYYLRNVERTLPLI